MSKALLVLAAASLALPLSARQRPGMSVASQMALLRQVAQRSAPAGSEGPVLQAVAAAIAAHPGTPAAKFDSLGNLTYSFAGSAPHPWLVVTEVDEPSYVVSGITADGYLRLQEARDGAPLPAAATLLFAHPLTILTESRAVTGIGAGLSIHLQPSRQPSTTPAYHLDNVYVDVGAGSAAQDARAGIQVLDPVTLEHQTFAASGSPIWVGTALSARAAIPALAALVERLAATAARPPLVVAFATQGYFGHRGLQRLLAEFDPATVVLLQPGPGPGWSVAGSDPSLTKRWLAASAPMPLQEISRPLTRIFAPPATTSAAEPLSYLVVDYPIGHLHTDAEMLDTREVGRLAAWLPSLVAANFGEGEVSPARSSVGSLAAGRQEADDPAPSSVTISQPATAGAAESPLIRDLRRLVETTGVSAHEGPVRELIRGMIAQTLPAGADVHVDPDGNLLVAWGPADAASSILFIAHMDEIGWQVSGFLPDGTLALSPEGRGIDAFYANHAALLHTTRGIVPGALTFSASADGVLARLETGMTVPAEQARGIALGDPVAVPKRYRPLLDHRASARSFDDRVGCAALVAALRALRDYHPARRRVIFAWSTGEELGLVGATALARRLHPTAVFALDTFVSSDSPLENQRFADAPLGEGFVIRAVDNGLITPRQLVERVRALAHRHGIPVQAGATGGSTDGVPFVRTGSQVVAIGWPLRYSHSPGEVIDTRDVEALAAIVPVLAQEW